MSKAKAKPAPEAKPEETNGQPVPEATETPAEPPTVESLQTQIADLTAQLAKQRTKSQRIADAEHEVREAEGELVDAKEHTKECKEVYEAAVTKLRREINRTEGQGELPFPEEPAAELPEDTAAAMPITSLMDFETPAGKLTAKMAENIAAACGGDTIGHFEAWQRENRDWETSIEGIGPTRISIVLDAWLAFRQANPMPTEPVAETNSDEASEADATPFDDEQAAATSNGTIADKAGV